MSATTAIREPAVAGRFYPADAATLRQIVEGFLAEVSPPEADAPAPRAIVAPHAGFPFSGPVAAAAYARVRPLAGRIRRVVLLGPSHRVPFRGIATTDSAYYGSPLGDIPVDREAVDALAGLPGVQSLDAAHGPEHSLEAQLPFLQVVLGDFRLVPLVVGDASPDQVEAVLDRLWDDPGTLVVVSSDLSHFHDEATAQRLDAATQQVIERMDDTALGPEDACGCRPLAGLLRAARRRGLGITTLDRRTSADTAGPRDQVVGYGAWALQ